MIRLKTFAVTPAQLIAVTLKSVGPDFATQAHCLQSNVVLNVTDVVAMRIGATLGGGIGLAVITHTVVPSTPVRCLTLRACESELSEATWRSRREVAFADS